MNRRGRALTVFWLGTAAVFASSAAIAAPIVGSDAGWSTDKRFIHGPEGLDYSLRTEVASDGRAVVTLGRDALERKCVERTSWLRTAAGRWRAGAPILVRQNEHRYLVADARLAWVVRSCSGGVELRYATGNKWDEPAVLVGGPPAIQLRAGMNADGLVALARPRSGSIRVDSARPGDGWAAAPSLGTPDATAVVDHVSVTNDDQMVVVWHVGPNMSVSTRATGAWSTVAVPGSMSITRVYVGSDHQGHIVIARAVGYELYVSVRAPDGTVSGPEHLTDALAYRCSYVCAAVEVRPDGNAFVAWASTRALTLGRRDVDGTWTTEVVDPQRFVQYVALDVHDDGSVVLADEPMDTKAVWACGWAAPCERLAYPPRSNSAEFAAGPGGTVYAVAGARTCDDGCDFERLGYFVHDGLDRASDGWVE